MPKLPGLRPREAASVLLKTGFTFIRQKGSHRIYVKGRLAVTLPWHNKDLRKGTLRQVIRQSGLTTEEFLRRL
jgi:predicted RNA binding protein YcfA (HicA-like mRNA interferase family)